MDSTNYWKLRAKITEALILEERAQRLIAQASIIKNSILIEVGLDPSKNYNMDDNKCEVIEVNNSKEQIERK